MATLTASLLLVGACSGSGADPPLRPSSSGPSSLSVTEALIGESSSEAAAAYVTLRNDGGADAVITGASCECAEDVSLHATEVVDGVTMMVPLEDLTVEAGDTLTMSPGGTHVMLEQLRRPLTAGDEVDMELHTEGTTLAVTARVVPLAELSELVERPR